MKTWNAALHRCIDTTGRQKPLPLEVTVATFDVFKGELVNGEEPAARTADIESALSCVEALGICAPGRYVIVSQQTTSRFYLEVDSTGHMSVPKTHSSEDQIRTLAQQRMLEELRALGAA